MMSCGSLQIFVKGFGEGCTAYQVNEGWTVRELKTLIQDREGLPIRDQVLSYGGRRLVDGCPINLAGLCSGATIHVSGQLRGGKPVKVQMMTGHLPCGGEVMVDLEESSTVLDLKRQLQAATGVPLQEQKVMLSGIGQLAMGDKRTNIKFGSCGTANSISLAVQAADKAT